MQRAEQFRRGELPVTMRMAASLGGASTDDPMEEFSAAKRRRILLVDDVVDDAQMLAELLNHWGQEARAVGDGALALEIVSSFAPDVVILDLDMPGLDGFEVAKALKKMPGLEKVGIFALSAWSDYAVRERCAQVGFHRFSANLSPRSKFCLPWRNSVNCPCRCATSRSLNFERKLSMP